MLNTSSASSHVIGKKVTLESGSSHSNTISQKALIGNDAPQVLERQEVNDTVVLSGQQDSFQTYHPGMLQPSKSGFSALSSDDKKLARKVMKDLDKKARLFARDENEQLVRISPATGKQMLDAGQPVEVVRVLGQTNKSSGSTRSGSYQNGGIFLRETSARSSSSESSKTVAVNYANSPVSDWDSLLWHEDEDYAGVPGTASLPKSGNTVTISQEFENRWQKSSSEEWGWFGQYHDNSQSSGYNRSKVVAEG